MGEDMNCHEMQLTVSWATEMYAAPLYARGLKVAGKADEAMSVTRRGHLICVRLRVSCLHTFNRPSSRVSAWQRL